MHTTSYRIFDILSVYCHTYPNVAFVICIFHLIVLFFFRSPPNIIFFDQMSTDSTHPPSIPIWSRPLLYLYLIPGFISRHSWLHAVAVVHTILPLIVRLRFIFALVGLISKGIISPLRWSWTFRRYRTVEYFTFVRCIH